MSNIALSGNASGTGTFTIASPNSNTNRTLDLPDNSGTVVLDSATQTLTNKTIQGGAITSGTVVASTSGTSIDFTGIPSWAKRITVMFSGVSTNGSSPVQVQVGSGSISTTSYSCSSSVLTSGVSTTAASTGILISNSGAAANLRNGSMVLSLVSGNTWVASGSGAFGDGTATWITGGATPNLSGTLDRIRITTVNGTDTFDAGSINILYEG